ncbi:MAG: BON domain-containing protein [Roseiarcus sp.]
MADILLDSNIARAIGRALQSQVGDMPAMDSFHRALADILLTACDTEEAPQDAEIRKAISARLGAEGGAHHALVSISVHDGVVEFRGTTPSEHHREALRAAAQGVPGVKAVHDHLIWMDEATGVFMPSPEDSAPG